MERKQLDVGLQIAHNFFEGREAVAIFVDVGLVPEKFEVNFSIAK
jgi:hypothetical protein